MKRKGHKHKESFSILLISNTGQRNRQFHISKWVSRLVIFFLLILCIAVGLMGWMIYQGYAGNGGNAGQKTLRAELDSKEELVNKLEQEKESLHAEKQALEEEIESLRQEISASEQEEVKEEEEPEKEKAAETDSSIPRRYPSSGISAVLSSYSEEQPYLSINTHEEGSIIATGNGTVVKVTSDDTYPVIIEVEHEKGYRTCYMSRQEADVSATEGAQVEAGDTLFTITVDDTQLDYQITFEGEPIDPLTVIEAKG